MNSYREKTNKYHIEGKKLLEDLKNKVTLL